MSNELLRKARLALQNHADAVRYDSVEDEVGRRVCCGVASYKPHENDCEITTTIASIDAHLASQPDSVAVMVDVNTILVVMRVLTFLKGVLIGLGFKPDSSSINQLEIAYSMLRDAPGVTE